MNTEYQPNWDFYFTELDGSQASIYLDLGLNRIAPLKDKNYLLTVILTMNDPQENGFSSNGESEKLFKIEDKIADALIEPFNAIFAGRETCDGARIFYFYAPKNNGVKKAVKDVMKAYSDYQFEVYFEEDSKWKQYFKHLYPTNYEMHTIMNRRVVENLRSKDDNLSVPRDVDNYIFFKKEDLKKKFLKEAEKMGYRLSSERTEEKDTEYPLSVRLTKQLPVTYHDVLDFTAELYDLAEQYDGVYDGWETKVITGKS